MRFINFIILFIFLIIIFSNLYSHEILYYGEKKTFSFNIPEQTHEIILEISSLSDDFEFIKYYSLVEDDDPNINLVANELYGSKIKTDFIFLDFENNILKMKSKTFNLEESIYKLDIFFCNDINCEYSEKDNTFLDNTDIYINNYYKYENVSYDLVVYKDLDVFYKIKNIDLPSKIILEEGIYEVEVKMNYNNRVFESFRLDNVLYILNEEEASNNWFNYFESLDNNLFDNDFNIQKNDYDSLDRNRSIFNRWYFYVIIVIILIILVLILNKNKSNYRLNRKKLRK